MSTQLQIYNGALRLCGERLLSALTDAVESRRMLDDVWDDNGIDACLAMGHWKFAMRQVQVDYDTAITPSFGFNRAFSKPTDWVLTSAICSDEFFRVPLLRVDDAAGYWYTDIDTIYVRYISNDASYGADLSAWPVTFADFVKAYFAKEIITRLTSDENKELKIQKDMEKKLLIAQNKDAMSGATSFPPQGSWSGARTAGSRNDRGNRGSLIG